MTATVTPLPWAHTPGAAEAVTSWAAPVRELMEATAHAAENHPSYAVSSCHPARSGHDDATARRIWAADHTTPPPFPLEARPTWAHSARVSLWAAGEATVIFERIDGPQNGPRVRLAQHLTIDLHTGDTETEALSLEIGLDAATSDDTATIPDSATLYRIRRDLAAVLDAQARALALTEAQHATIEPEATR